jgi:hypothetical protein
MARQRTAAQMTRLVAQWRTSGESQAGFARRHRIRPWTFWYWCRKLSSASAERPARPDVPTTFVPVQVTDAPPTAAVAIVLVDGTQIQVHAGASAALVQAVVAAVRAAC